MKPPTAEESPRKETAQNWKDKINAINIQARNSLEEETKFNEFLNQVQPQTKKKSAHAASRPRNSSYFTGSNTPEGRDLLQTRGKSRHTQPKRDVLSPATNTLDASMGTNVVDLDHYMALPEKDIAYYAN